MKSKATDKKVVRDKVDVLITDCPILMSIYYGKELGEEIKYKVREKFYEYDNLNLLIIEKS